MNDRQMDPLSELIDEDIEWNLYGPIDLFPFLGSRRGRPAVVEVCRQLANNVKFYRFDREAIMLGENTAASMMRYSLTVLDTDKPISLRLAHFAQFKNGRLSRLRAVLDSFDLVEQSLGYQIHLPQMA